MTRGRGLSQRMVPLSSENPNNVTGLNIQVELKENIEVGDSLNTSEESNMQKNKDVEEEMQQKETLGSEKRIEDPE